MAQRYNYHFHHKYAEQGYLQLLHIVDTIPSLQFDHLQCE